MRIALTELGTMLLVLLLITQVLLPLCFPKKLKMFWLFRKDKEPEDSTPPNSEDLSQQVSKVVGMKKETDAAIKDVHKKTKEHLRDATTLNKTVEGLK
jgi:hypothetical protein